MTLKPIPGAPTDAPIPDFPAGNPGPLDEPPSRFTRRAVGPLPFSLPPSEPSPSSAPVRRPDPAEIRGDGNSALIFRANPEIPAITRSSMTISITGGAAADDSPHLDLATDKARAFLLALRDGAAPVVIGDSQTGIQVEFVLTEDGPTFIVSSPGHQRISRRFNAGLNYDVRAMAAHLLADLGP